MICLAHEITDRSLALRNIVAKWTGSRHDWKSAMTRFALLYPERFNIGV